MNFSHRIIDSRFSKVFRILPKQDRNKIPLVVAIQVFFGLFDLVGVGLIGVLGALVVSGVEEQNPGSRVTIVLKLLNLEAESLQVQAAGLALLAATTLIAKTLFSMYFIRRTFHFLSIRGAQISTILNSKLFAQDMVRVQERSSQETLYALTTGVNALSIGVIGAAVNLVSDITLLVIIGAGLFYVDTTMAFSTFILFGFIALSLYFFMKKKAEKLSRILTTLNISSSEMIIELLDSYRESVVRNRRNYYTRRIGVSRTQMAGAAAEMSFMPYIGKYVIEISIVVGAVAISAIQFATNTVSYSVATLAVFLAASTRIAPAVLRLQQGVISIRSNLVQAEPTIELMDKFGLSAALATTSDTALFLHPNFEPVVQVSEVNLTYPNSIKPALNNISLKIEAGEFVAIVGPSGSGKTSLVDVILGVTQPSSGQVHISSLKPLDAISRWPGSIGYVPQNVAIVNSDVKGNICLGFPYADEYESFVTSSIQASQLTDLIDSLPGGLDSLVGEGGAKLSGGQRQRLGIARALFTQPHLLVLDEATSALDAETEERISAAVQSLKGRVTIIVIAHRLSTVRNADKVCYLEGGNLVATGSFDQVRNSVPNFDHQAQLMGL